MPANPSDGIPDTAPNGTSNIAAIMAAPAAH
jgi:hypothetical protein